MKGLNEALLAAHAAGDAVRLVTLYRAASENCDDPNQAAFYLTQAHVYALEIDHPDAAMLRQRLIDAGREAPLPPPIPPRR
ncbi:MAG: hypothetical protein HKN30_05420 [Sulfitobacter sp.]|nr:hypothetical protein [Sulfitobacter sp.]